MVSSKNIEANLLQNMFRMIRRNLKICLALLPELSQLRRQLQYRPGISIVERDTWKDSHGEKQRSELKHMLKHYKLPLYLLNFLEWLFLATEKEVARLKAFVRNPRGEVPTAYNYLTMPAFQFSSPFRVGWMTDAGYRVAIMTVEKPNYWQIWGTQMWGGDTGDRSLDDNQAFSPVLLKQMLRDSGDFVVRGSLDLFDAHSWRELGKFLSRVKKGKGMGKPLGLVAGRQKGAIVKRKRVLQDMSWPEIQILVAEQPQQYNRLQNEYANHENARYREEFKQSNPGQNPPATEQRRIRKNAISNYRRYVKKPVLPKAKKKSVYYG